MALKMSSWLPCRPILEVMEMMNWLGLMFKDTVHHQQINGLNATHLAFCMQNRSFCLYSNTAVVPQKVFGIVILHEVHNIIDAEWRTNFYLHKSE